MFKVEPAGANGRTPHCDGGDAGWGSTVTPMMLPKRWGHLLRRPAGDDDRAAEREATREDFNRFNLQRAE